LKPDRDTGLLFSSRQIEERIKEMVRTIERDFRDKDLVVIAVLKGSVLFLADLVRGFSRPLAFDFIGVSSYGHSRTSLGVVSLEKEVSIEIRDKDVLVVDDILDSGRTLGWVKEHLAKFNPRSVKVCVLLQKKVKRVINVRADYVGFEIPDVFIYGYGLDYRDRYRHLPYIAQLPDSEVPPGEGGG
jgi:hypoxanthine phosphoribosyltransferase